MEMPQVKRVGVAEKWALFHFHIEAFDREATRYTLRNLSKSIVKVGKKKKRIRILYLGLRVQTRPI